MYKISTNLSGCFSAEMYIVEIDDERSLIQVMRSSGLGAEIGKYEEVKVADDHVEAFKSEIEAILGKPEKLRGDRTTNVYRVNIEFGGREITVESSEVPQLQLEELTEDSSCSPSLRQKVLINKVDGYHNWSHELHRLTKKFVESALKGAAA